MNSNQSSSPCGHLASCTFTIYAAVPGYGPCQEWGEVGENGTLIRMLISFPQIVPPFYLKTVTFEDHEYGHGTMTSSLTQQHWYWCQFFLQIKYILKPLVSN